MRTILGFGLLLVVGCACPEEGRGSASASAHIEATAGGSSTASGGEAAPPPEGARVAAGSDLCEPSECGPQMGMPNQLCPDGTTTAGPSGRCLRNADGACGWEVIECPG